MTIRRLLKDDKLAGQQEVERLSRIAQLDQRTALPDQCLHSAEADVRPPRRKSGFGSCGHRREGRHAICVLNPRDVAGAPEIMAQFGAEQLPKLHAL